MWSATGMHLVEEGAAHAWTRSDCEVLLISAAGPRSDGGERATIPGELRPSDSIHRGVPR